MSTLESVQRVQERVEIAHHLDGQFYILLT